jgi:antitoxin MazE
MRIQLSRWGNSTGLRVPSGVLDQLDLRAGAHLDLTIADGVIELRPVRRTSRDLLIEMAAEARRLGPHAEPDTIDWEADRGTEVLGNDDPR